MVPQIHIGGLDAFEDIDVFLRQFDVRDGDLDLSGFVPTAKRILRVGRMRAALRGTDKDGRPLTPVSRETEKRRARARKGSGPPLAPDGPDSSTVQDFEVAGRASGNKVHLAVDWPNSPWVGHHARGIPTKNGVVVRNIAGVDTQTLQELTDAFADYVMGQVGSGGFTGAFKRAFNRIFGRRAR